MQYSDLAVSIWRWIFGQHKLEYSVVGIMFGVLAICGILFAWLGTWGLLLWLPMMFLAVLLIGPVGHFLIPMLLAWPIAETIRRLRRK